MRSIRFVFGLSAMGLMASAAFAQWGYRGAPGGYGYSHPGQKSDPRDGAMNVSTYLAKGQDPHALGHGGIAVAEAPGTMGAGRESATYEAAVVDQLARAGYDINANSSAQAELAELVITHDVVQPEEPPHSPVGGDMSVDVGNRGSGMSLGLYVDARKPLKALVATRLDARIRDKATNALLWEGHAEIITREGDKYWTSPMIAARLAAALFRGFPNPS